MQSSWWHMERSREVVVVARVSARVNSVTSSFSRELRLPARGEGGEGGGVWVYYYTVGVKLKFPRLS